LIKRLRTLFLCALVIPNISFGNSEIVSQFVEQAYSILPSTLNHVVQNNVKFKVTKLNQQEVNFCEEIPAKARYASYSSFFNEIKISKSLIKSYLSCPDKLKSIIIKTVIHELFHAYDVKAKVIKNTEMKCLSSVEAYKQNKTISNICKRFNSNNNRSLIISDDRVYKVLSQIHGKNEDNFKGTRTLDPYELKNHKEYSAINFESFMLDSEYKCRRPSMYKYFSNHFNFNPFKNTECHSTNLIFSNAQDAKHYELDPTRVYQVHYLHASKGEATVSSFGHSMLRVVMCAPGRSVGEDCLKDIDHHIVLSFRANVGDIKTDTLKGITGGYPSQLIIMSLKDAIKEYNVRELRDLYSYPLTMTKQEQNFFLKRTLETFWEYAGSYKFFTNNCASETYKFVVGADLKLTNKLYSSMTPNGILEDFMKVGYIDSKYKDLEQLNRLNIFRSNYRYIKIAYKQLFNESIDKSDFLELIEKDPSFLDLVTQHHEYKLQIDKKSMTKKQLKKEHLKNFSAIYLIEKMIFDTKKEQLKFYTQELILGKMEDGFVQGIDMKDLVPKSIASQLKGSYGIPNNEEMDELINNKTEINTEVSDQIFHDLIKDQIQDKINEIKNMSIKINNINKSISLIKKHKQEI
jgi:hypothetical protein